jgi:alpha-glucosidase
MYYSASGTPTINLLKFQEPGYTTTESRQNPWSLIAALNSTGGASGDIYIDDGESIKPNATLEVTLTISDKKLSASNVGNYSVDQPLGNVTILGVERPSNVSFSGGSYIWSWIDNNLLVTGFDNVSAWNNAWTLSWQ